MTINIRVLNERYSALLPKKDIDKFAETLNSLKKKLNFELINENKPLLIYSRNMRNELYYLLSLNYSVQKGRVLNYVVVTGQTFVREHFADKEKDLTLYDSIYNDDIVYVSLNEDDYTSEYLESLLSDLIEYRYRNNKITVITYDVLQGNRYLTQTNKLNTFFRSSGYTIIDLVQITSKHSATTNNNNNKNDTDVKQGRARRII